MEQAANSLHIGYLDFAKITFKTSKIMIRDKKIPLGKEREDVRKWLKYEVEHGSDGIKYTVEWDFCSNFAAEGMVNLVETNQYSKIRDKYLQILNQDIEDRVAKYNYQ